MTGFCLVNGCDRLSYGRGYCKRHYTQVIRHGHVTNESELSGPQRCEAPGCENDRVSHGYCRKHSRQIKEHGELTPDKEYMLGLTECSEDGCDKKVRARGLCVVHYTRRRRDGTLP